MPLQGINWLKKKKKVYPMEPKKKLNVASGRTATKDYIQQELGSQFVCVCVCLSHRPYGFSFLSFLPLVLSANCFLCLLWYMFVLWLLSLCVPGSSNQSRLSSVLNPNFLRGKETGPLGVRYPPLTLSAREAHVPPPRWWATHWLV